MNGDVHLSGGDCESCGAVWDRSVWSAWVMVHAVWCEWIAEVSEG